MHDSHSVIGPRTECNVELCVSKIHCFEQALRTSTDYLLFPYQSRFILDQQ